MMKIFLSTLFCLFYLISTAQCVRNVSCNDYEIRIVYKQEILCEGILHPGGTVCFPRATPIELFFRRKGNSCDENNVSKAYVSSLPVTKHRNVRLPDRWIMVKIDTAQIMYLPLYFCHRA